MKWIIVEGAKGTGKSTLCQKLHNELGWPIVHFPTDSKYGKLAMQNIGNDKCQEYMLEDIRQKIKKMVETGKNYILDRSFISNAVYSENNKIIDEFLPILKFSEVIILHEPIEILKKRLENRKGRPILEWEWQMLEKSNNNFLQLLDILNRSNI